MRQLRTLLGGALFLGMVFGESLFVLAQPEFGEKGQAGQKAEGAANIEVGNAAAPAEDEDSENATILEAAAALDATRPDLAAKLRALVE